MASKTPAKQQPGQSPMPRVTPATPTRKVGYGRLVLVALLGVFLANLTKSLFDAGEVRPELRRVLRRGALRRPADRAAAIFAC